MIERPQNPWKLGLFLTGIAGLAVGVLIWFGTRGLGRPTLQAVSYFDESVEGLSVGSPLSFRGVPMGKVERITFAPNGRDVEVHLRIYADVIERLGLSRYVLFPSASEPGEGANVRIQLNRSGLTGVTFLEADFFDPAQFPERQLDFDTPFNTIPTQPSTLSGVGQSLAETLAGLPSLLTSAQSLVERLDTDLDQLEVTPLLEQARETLADAEQAFELLAGDRAEELLDAASRASRAVTRAAGTEGITGDATRSLAELDRTLVSLRRLLDLLERDPAALIRGRTSR